MVGCNGEGNESNQLKHPNCLYVDDDQTLYTGNSFNNHIKEWKCGATSGKVVASGNGEGNRANQLFTPTDNEVRRYRVGDTHEIVVAGGNGKGNRLNQLNSLTYLFVDRNHSFYVLNRDNHQVMKWIKGLEEGIVVAGDQGH
ncbi:unnamed protein product [Rotaria sp. Silwood1]|nr:unnamed protein product [Rotaria sp. Silwood1]